MEKLVSSFFKKDPRRAALDEFINLNLSNPDDYKRAQELVQEGHFSNLDTSDLNRINNSFKGRLNSMSLFEGSGIRFPYMHTLNHDYSSATAGDDPTLVYYDPEMRAIDNAQIANFVDSHSPSERRDNYDIYSATNDAYTTRGSFSIVDTRNGKVRHVDGWDYEAPAWVKRWLLPRQVVMADEIDMSAPRATTKSRLLAGSDDTHITDDMNLWGSLVKGVSDYFTGKNGEK